MMANTCGQVVSASNFWKWKLFYRLPGRCQLQTPAIEGEVIQEKSTNWGLEFEWAYP